MIGSGRSRAGRVILMLKTVSFGPGSEAAAAADAVSRSIRCAMPGLVTAFDSATRTAAIRLALKDDDGEEFPLLTGVPVFFPGNVLFPVNEGDECLVIFADRCIDGWYTEGGVSDPPVKRTHDLSDGFAFVGFSSPGRLNASE